MNILGLSFGYHDSAAALIRDGRILWAIQEERFSRIKNDPRFPARAVEYILSQAPEKIDAVVFYEKPILKFDRILGQFLTSWPFSYSQFREALPQWLTNKFRVRSQIYAHLQGQRPPIFFCKHHESHAASCFFTSPFSEAAILTLDGVGEYECGAIHRGQGHHVQTMESRNYPDSLGLFYSAFTDYLGFEVNEGEYKVMGLAPYGSPRFQQSLIKNLIAVNDEGQVHLNRDYLSFPVGERAFSVKKIQHLLGVAPRSPGSPLTQEHFDLTSSIQKILEDAVLKSARHALKLTGSRHLCFAGGVALNCVANGKVLQSLKQEDLLDGFHLFPACGDAGGAVGAALWFHHLNHDGARVPAEQILPFWGASFHDEEVENALLAAGLKFQRVTKNDLTKHAACLVEEGLVLGWFQGRTEFGPRALGNRSIVADPRRKENWQRINRMVKFREDFRPLAPAVLEEKAPLYFEFSGKSPLMLLIAQNRTDNLPAVTHVDGSSRLQTVGSHDNPLFYDLIREFEKVSGTPCLINTSFNTSGMPIVNTPRDAVRCFFESDLDGMFLGTYLILRKENPWVKK